MEGMTLKQFAKRRFLQLCSEWQELKKRGLHTPEDCRRCIELALMIHIAKNDVPKSYWKLAN